MAMAVDNKNRIQNNYSYVRNSIDPNALGNYLYSEDTNTTTQHESISEKKGRAASNECVEFQNSRPACFSENPKKDMKEEYRVVLIGKTGSGKSFLGNNILGQQCFCSKAGSQSVTKEYKRGERMIDKDRKLVLVDTPGLFDTRNNDNMETANILTRAVQDITPGPHVFILVLSINSRYTAEEKTAIEFLKDLLGSHVTDYLIVVFTGKDTIDYDDIDLETYIDEADTDLKDLLRQCRGHIAINNWASREEVTQTVDSLLAMIKDVYLQNRKKYYIYKSMTEAREKI